VNMVRYIVGFAAGITTALTAITVAHLTGYIDNAIDTHHKNLRRPTEAPRHRHRHVTRAPARWTP
jgi:hypothetical protein